MIQTQFINYLLATKDSSIIELNNLNEDYFSEFKGEFKFILNHKDRYGSIPDVETFLNVFPDFEIFNVEEPASYLIEELFKDYSNHKMAEALNKMRPLLIEGKTEQAMKMFKEASDNLHTGVSLTCVDILKDTSRYDAYVEKTKNIGAYYLPTGFRELDKILGGIDMQEELGVIMARTNLGKSWILDFLACNAVKHGKRVGIYSGEMSENKVGYRVDTFLGGISNGSLTHGNANVHEKYKKYIEELPTKYGNACLKVLTPQMISGPAGVNALRMFIEKENLDILFIDQLSLLEDDRHARDKVERASNISWDLKNLQVMKRIPIISVSQQNRSKNDDDDVLDTTQVAMSDRIGQDATFVIGITRDKKDDTIVNLHIVKSRDSGGVGKKLTYIVDFNNGTYTYVPQEDEESPQTQTDEDDINYIDESKYEVHEDDGEELFQ